MWQTEKKQREQLTTLANCADWVACRRTLEDANMGRKRYDDEDDRDEPRRKKPFSVLWVVGVMVLLGGVTMAALVIFAVGKTVASAPTQPLATSKQLHEITIGKETRIRDIGVTATWVGLQGASARDEFGQWHHQGVAVVCRISIVNYNANRVVKARPQTLVAKMKDDFGNVYKAFYILARPHVTAVVDGQIGPDEVLPLRSESQAKQDHNDIVMFERPPVGSLSCTILLDTEAYGENTILSLNVPNNNLTQEEEVMKIMLEKNRQKAIEEQRLAIIKADAEKRELEVAEKAKRILKKNSIVGSYDAVVQYLKGDKDQRLKIISSKKARITTDNEECVFVSENKELTCIKLYEGGGTRQYYAESAQVIKP